MEDTSSPAVRPSGMELSRQTLPIRMRSLVSWQDRVYRISEILDFQSVVGTDVETGRAATLRISELKKVDVGELVPRHRTGDLEAIADQDFRIAEKRLEAIRPLLDSPSVGRREIEARSQEVGAAPASLYRWLRRYKAYGELTALIPMKRGWVEGRSRISPEAEALIQKVIEDFYLTLQRPTAQKTYLEVLRLCKEKGMDPPSSATVRARIERIEEKVRLRTRGFKERANAKFSPVPGHFPNADFPLAVVQIDHTPADIIVVDDVYRRPIGRPYFTLAMDVYSRMVVGYYLSFDPPSETSVAMCVAHMMIPKEEWLDLHGVDAQWPVWGKPKTIHVDNGADFRSDNFQKACLAYDINLEFRLVKQPRYGGHIERLLGTILRQIHALPGTTFSSVKDREGYDSEKHSAMTLTELEEWLVTYICKQYHTKKHSALGISPLKQWEIGVFGTATTVGVGHPDRPTDRLTILLDFLPYFKRTIQTFGVSIEGLTYYAECLRPWIGSVDPASGKTREFTFRRDPRDLSKIWFYDPGIQQYFDVPFANQNLPAISVWEYRQVREIQQKAGIKEPNDHQLIQTITELREKVDQAKQRTKRARREFQRRKEHEKKISPAAPLVKSSQPENNPAAASLNGLVDGDVEDFGSFA